MNGRIVERLKNIEKHAETLMWLPATASEENIRNTQVAVVAALLDIKFCLEELAILAQPLNP